MDSLKMFKGYGKVEDDHHLEDQQQLQQPPRPKTSTPLIATISIFAILILTLTLAFAIAALIHHTNTESPEEPLNSAATSTIRAVCNVTRFPNSCFSSISSSSFHQNPTDPEAILKLSLRVSLTELSNLASSLRAMNGPALADCKDQMDDALSRLNDSLLAMMEAAAPGGGRVLTDAKIGDIQTWVSAALTDQQTCLDGLEEMGSGDVGEVKNKMQRSSEYTSNSLAIVANIRTLLEQFHMPLH